MKEQETERKIRWGRVAIVMFVVLFPLLVYINVKIYDDASIFSWNHYIETGFKH